jgi:hypothetical protein
MNHRADLSRTLVSARAVRVPASEAHHAVTYVSRAWPVADPRALRPTTWRVPEYEIDRRYLRAASHARSSLSALAFVVLLAVTAIAMIALALSVWPEGRTAVVTIVDGLV